MSTRNRKNNERVNDVENEMNLFWLWSEWLKDWVMMMMMMMMMRVLNDNDDDEQNWRARVKRDELFVDWTAKWISKLTFMAKFCILRSHGVAPSDSTLVFQWTRADGHWKLILAHCNGQHPAPLSRCDILAPSVNELHRLTSLLTYSEWWKPTNS